MSNQTTFRYYVNNERVATAVYWKTGSKHRSPILEVYPLQNKLIQTAPGKTKRLQLIFSSEEEWRKHCERDYSRKPTTRLEVTTTPILGVEDISLVVTPTQRYVPLKESVTYRFFVNNQRVATAVKWGHGYTVLQVYPKSSNEGNRFKNLEEWRQIWSEKYTPRTYVKVTSSETISSYAPAFKAIDTPIISTPAPKPAPKPAIVTSSSSALDEAVKKDFEAFTKALNNKSTATTYWHCSICSLGPGNDHRMCIAQGYRWSKDPIGDWERDSGVRRTYEKSTPQPTAPADNSNTSSSSSKEVNPKDWIHKDKYKATFPPGKYYIGDLCYVLGNELYDKILIGLGDCEDGLFMKKGKEDTEFFMVGSTAYGDGCYRDNKKKEYCVDAGIIGICPMACVNKDDGGGQYHTFHSPVTCKLSGGVFKFESDDHYVCIDTAGNDEDEDCECDECE